MTDTQTAPERVSLRQLAGLADALDAVAADTSHAGVKDACLISAQRMRSAADEIRRLREVARPVPAGVRVKPLEWVRKNEWHHISNNPFGDCWVKHYNGAEGWTLYGPGHYGPGNIFPDLDAAKAAAQADYERRILSTLSTAPDVEGLARAAQTLLDDLEGPSHSDWQSVWNAMREDAWHGDMPAAMMEALRALAQKETGR